MQKQEALLAQASAVIRSLKEKLAQSTQRQATEPVAVVGMACRFPGIRENLDGFWETIESGFDAVSRIPRDRWNTESCFQPPPAPPGTKVPGFAGLLKHVGLFDAGFFDISPREAVTMDPQQRLLLEVAWHAFEDAGLTRQQLAGSETAVLVGVHQCSSDYQRLQDVEAGPIDIYSCSGVSHDVIAGRLSYLFDLKGASIVMNTACSSSLAAVHMARRSLLAGDCRMAVAAGLNLILKPDNMMYLGPLNVLAPDGRSKAFDASADGFGRGEGCGVVILKRLLDAISDGDRIYALIRGSAVNQDGRTNGLTAPNGLSQRAVVRKALSEGGVKPEDIGYVETHGTGTKLGDPIEVEALADVLGRADSGNSNPCVLGAVKANIAHLEGGAGIAGLIKTVMVLNRRYIPPVALLKEFNPHLPIEGSRIEIPKTGRPWVSKGKRFAGVSSFGWSGTNAHVVMEEAPELPPREPATFVHFAVTVSGTTPEALAAHARSYAAALEKLNPEDLRDFAYTSTLRRTHHAYRFAAVGSDPRVIAAGLREKAELRVAFPCSSEPSPIAFLFSDWLPDDWQQYRCLLDAEPALRASLGPCSAAIAAIAGWNLLEEIARPEAESRLPKPSFGQPAWFSIQVGLAEWLRHQWKVEPRFLGGFGLGQVAAAWAAGTLKLEEGIRIAMERGRLAQLAAKSPEQAAREMASALSGLRPSGPAIRLNSAPIDTIVAEGARALIGIGAAPPALVNPKRDVVCATVPAKSGVLEALACAYEVGQAVDWLPFRDPAARCISLPEYPFQRKRYWIEVPRDADAGAPADWLYRTEWREIPSVEERRTDAASSPSNLSLEQTIEDAAAGFVAATPNGSTLLRDLERESASHIFRALCELGVEFRAGRRFTASALGQELRIQPRYSVLFDRMLMVMVEEGVLDDQGIAYETTGKRLPPPSRKSPAGIESALLDKCASRLAEVLRGEIDPLDLLFGAAGGVNASALYRDGEIGKAYNGLLRKVFDRVIEQNARNGRPIRVVEVGAGTGSTTEVLLLERKSQLAQYVFTDISRGLISSSAENFANRRDLSPECLAFECLDIEKAPREQGFAEGVYDVVIASNVLHATRSLNASLENCRKLLAPGGVLLLLETTAVRRWIELTFGLTDGWWRFNDRSDRPEYPLLSPAQWTGMLQAAGFEDCAASAQLSSEETVELTVLAARAPARREESWAIVANDPSSAAGLLEALASAGAASVVACVATSSEELPSGCTAIVDLRPLELWTSGPQSRVAEKLALDAIELARSVIETRFAQPPRLWIVTRGAVPAHEGEEPSVSGASLWGLGSSLAVEHPEIWGGLIDLDPAGKPSASEWARLGQYILDAGANGAAEEDQVAFRGTAQLVPRLRRIAGPASREPLAILPDATYVITGAFGGIGLNMAAWLAALGARHLALISRSGKRALEGDDPAAVDRLRAVEALQSEGVTVRIEACDLGVDGECNRLFEQLGREMPPVKGILHAAADIRLKPLAELSEADVHAAFHSKLAGAEALAAAADGLSLDFLILFSSISSQLGGLDSSAYAAANRSLEAYAVRLHRAGVPAMAFSWGVWDVAATAVSPDQVRAILRSGYRPMLPPAALDAMRLFAGSGEYCGCAVADIDWKVRKPAVELRGRKHYLDDIALQATAPITVAKTAGGREAFLEQFRKAAAARKQELLLDLVSSNLRRVFGLGESDPVEMRRGFFEMGLDSLMSVELKNRLEAATGLALPGTLTLNYPNVTALANHLLAKLEPAPPPAPATHGAPRGLISLDRELAVGEDVAELSDEEAKKALAAELINLSKDFLD